MASANGNWSKGKFYSAKLQRQLSAVQRRALADNELKMTAGQYARLHSKAQMDASQARAAMRRTVGRARQINQALATTPPRRRGVGKTVKTYGTDPTKTYRLRYEVRELDDLVTSNTASGAVNPDYPQELQPRDRTRAASRQQIDSIARRLEPDAFLEEFRSIDRGAPIIGDDGAVESGNGRTMALQRAAEEYPERYEAYKARLRQAARAQGINPADVDKLKRPVLVRVHAEPVDRVAFAQEANYGTVMGMSDTERASSDAARITQHSLMSFDIGEGDVDQALRRSSNREFIRSFVSSLPETERAQVMTRQGELTQAGSRRIQAAMFARVYGETRVGERIFESTDDDLKNVSRGLMGSLGRLSQSEELVRSGQRASDLSITGDVLAASSKLIELKEKKMSVEWYQQQGKLFGEDLTPTQQRIMVAINERRRSGKKIGDFLAGWADIVERQPHPGQGGLFGSMADSKEALVEKWLLSSGHDDQQQQGRLF